MQPPLPPALMKMPKHEDALCWQDQEGQAWLLLQNPYFFRKSCFGEDTNLVTRNGNRDFESKLEEIRMYFMTWSLGHEGVGSGGEAISDKTQEEKVKKAFVFSGEFYLDKCCVCVCLCLCVFP